MLGVVIFATTPNNMPQHARGCAIGFRGRTQVAVWEHFFCWLSWAMSTNVNILICLLKCDKIWQKSCSYQTSVSEGLKIKVEQTSFVAYSNFSWKLFCQKFQKLFVKKYVFFPVTFFKKMRVSNCKLSVNSPGNLRTGLCVNLLNSRF